MNIAAITGRLGADPELRQGGYTGTQYARFSVAVRDGKDKTLWIRVVAFGTTANFISQYGRKGSSVAVLGRLHVSEKDGKTYTEIVATTVDLIDPKKGADAPPEAEPIVAPDPFA